jgi:hypothetical protein
MRTNRENMSQIGDIFDFVTHRTKACREVATGGLNGNFKDLGN